MPRRSAATKIRLRPQFTPSSGPRTSWPAWRVSLKVDFLAMVGRMLSSGKGAVFTVSPVAKVHGRIPKRAHKMILQWARVNRAALLMDWEAARDHRALREIPPLE